MLNDWQDQRYIATIAEKSLVITRWNEGYVIEVIESKIVKQRATELCSYQEEADTEIFFAAKFVGSLGCNKLPI